MAHHGPAWIVVQIRAQALADALQQYILISGLPFSQYRRLSAMQDAHWQAQRLRSTCEKMLGVRDR